MRISLDDDSLAMLNSNLNKQNSETAQAHFSLDVVLERLDYSLGSALAVFSHLLKVPQPVQKGIYLIEFSLESTSRLCRYSKKFYIMFSG